MDKERELPPRPGEDKKVEKQIKPPVDAIPLYIQGMNFPLTEGEALGVISQLSSALQTRRAGMEGVMRNA